jgi:hypothetical protein
MFEVTEWRHVRRRSDANFSWGCTNKRVTSSSVIALLETGGLTSSAREHPLLRKCSAASLDFNLDGYYKDGYYSTRDEKTCLATGSTCHLLPQNLDTWIMLQHVATLVSATLRGQIESCIKIQNHNTSKYHKHHNHKH